jgi:DNA polymerase III sliding clamp (beta) subunit (PCNA family)
MDPPSTKPITLGPMEADLLGEMVRNFAGEVGLTDEYIIYQATNTYSGEYFAQISLIPPLKYDLAKVVIPYMRNSNRQYEIPRESIAAFIRRATYLAETRQRTRVTLTADTNSISLRFAENMAQTDEQFEIADLGVDTPMKINVDALKLGRALSRCNQLVLDHIENKALVFKSKDGDFVYIVAGQAEMAEL